MASLVYDDFLDDVMKEGHQLATDTIKAALVTATYTPNAATHSTFADVTNEVVGTGYTAGGATLASKTVGTLAAGAWDAADTSWTTSSITARAAVLYNTTNADKLIAYVDFLANYTSVSGTFLITWSASGILTLSD